MRSKVGAILTVMVLLTLLAGCAPATPQIVEVVKEVPVEKVVKETVVVEKEVPIEKKVVETVIVETEKKVVETVIVELPYATVEGQGYQDTTFRVDLGSITKDQLRKIKALRRGLDAKGFKLKNGKSIESNIDAVRYLIDALEI